MSRHPTKSEIAILPARRHDDRIYALAHRYAREQNADGLRRLFEAVIASVHPARYVRIIEMMAGWMIPNAELAGVLDEDGEPVASSARAFASVLVTAGRELASTIAIAAQMEPKKLKAWAKRLGPDDCPEAEAFRQALIEVAP